MTGTELNPLGNHYGKGHFKNCTIVQIRFLLLVRHGFSEYNAGSV